MTSPSPGIIWPAMTTTTSPVRSLELAQTSVVPLAQSLSLGFGSGFAECVGLGFAAALGHGFGEIGEEHREPEPQHDLKVEAEESRVARGVEDEFDGGEDAPTSTTNITGFLIIVPGIEFAERIADGADGRSLCPRASFGFARALRFLLGLRKFCRHS